MPNPRPVPSYERKIRRAEGHLTELKKAVDVYVGSRPYRVTRSSGPKKKDHVWRLCFSTLPRDTDIPVLAADAIFDLRAALDHLLYDLAPTGRSSKVRFPILWQGVWDPAGRGEKPRRAKDRRRWKRWTKGLDPQVVASLKGLQPPDDSGQGEASHFLRILSSLAEMDRHGPLPIGVAGLRNATVRWTMPAGALERRRETTGAAVPRLIADGEALDVPPDAVNVFLTGCPVITVHPGRGSVDVEVPDALEAGLRHVESYVVPTLLGRLPAPTPYVALGQ